MMSWGGIKAAPARGLVFVLALLASGPSPVADWQPDAPGLAAGEARGEGEVEAVLSRLLFDIEHGQVERALLRVESLIESHPNFLLAHLVKGDLLRMRGGGISQFGDVPGAPSERLEALRAEARARLMAQRQPPPRDAIPRALVQLGEFQDHAIVVDARSSRLYVFSNDQGRPRLLSDHYISQGKAGFEKFFEGDKRTPLGVYRVTEKLPRTSLSEFYGSGAYALNYPNEWDKRLGRRGSGIWLHGTPPDTYSRPPRASDGCVVLSNHDLLKIGRVVQPGHTPVVIAPAVEWVSEQAWQAEREALAQVVEAWRADRERGQLAPLLAHYSERMFETASRRAKWQQQLRDKLAEPGARAGGVVRITDVSLLRDPRDALFVATFELHEPRASGVARSRVQQYWLREQGQWKIVFEG